MQQDSPLGLFDHPQQIVFEAHKPWVMEHNHWHGHLEVNIPFGQPVSYSFNGQDVLIPADQVSIFWGAHVHRLTNSHDCPFMGILNLPVHLFLSWPLEHSLVNRLMNGAVLTARQENLLSQQQLIKWREEYEDGDQQLRQLVEQELILLLRKLSHYGWREVLSDRASSRSQHFGHPSSFTHIQKILQFIARNYDRRITVVDIAEHVNLHPKYVMQHFHRVMRMTVKRYVNSLRTSHARALLSDTSRPIMDIALAVGFSSTSRLYDAFKKEVGMTPKQYRDSFQRK
ncbi:transcriptional regulator MelR [Gynuella sp.]|uniref:transcriptional regulator MelR n=1 Tax=Gynuella sp. TaxID=2969146 RepID=UPI003D0D0A66